MDRAGELHRSRISRNGISDDWSSREASPSGAGLPRRDELQGNQGAVSDAGGEILAESKSTNSARQPRAGTDQTGEWSRRENYLRRERDPDNRGADPGSL